MALPDNDIARIAIQRILDLIPARWIVGAETGKQQAEDALCEIVEVERREAVRWHHRNLRLEARLERVAQAIDPRRDAQPPADE